MNRRQKLSRNNRLLCTLERHVVYACLLVYKNKVYYSLAIGFLAYMRTKAYLIKEKVGYGRY